MPGVGGGLSLRAGKPDLAPPWKKRLGDPSAAWRALYPPKEVRGFSDVGKWAPNTAVGPRPKEETPSDVEAAGLRVSKSMFPLWEERQGGARDLHLPAHREGSRLAPIRQGL